MPELAVDPSPSDPVVPDPNDRFFRTDHLHADLKGRSIRGGAITLAAQAVKFVLQLASTAILARLLTPADFGLVAMVTAVTGFVAMFNSFGIPMAVLHRDDLTHGQMSTLFWFNIAFSTVLTFLLCMAAPAIAWFYHQPELRSITLVLASCLLISAVSSQHRTLINRQMRFGTGAMMGLVSHAASVSVAVGMAWFGCGYWSLVALPVTMRFVETFIAWIQCEWRPTWWQRGTGIRSMLMMGGNVQGVDVANFVITNADNAILGWYHGPMSLGLYTRSYQLLTMPSAFVTMPVTSFAIPALCRLRSDPPQYQRFFIASVEAMAMAAMPMVALFFVAAPEIVQVFLGAQWREAGALFRLLTPAAFVGTIGVIPGWICISNGTVHRQFRWLVSFVPVFLLAFVAGLPWGAAGVAVACSSTFVIFFVGAVLYCTQGTPVRPVDVITAIRRALLSSLLAAIGLWLVRDHASVSPNPLLRLVVDSCLFSAMYAFALLALPGGASLRTRIRSLIASARRSGIH